MAGVISLRRYAGLASAVLLAVLVVALVPYAEADDPRDIDEPLPDEPEYPELVEIELDDRDELDALVATGIDLAESLTDTDDGGLIAEALVTETEQAALSEMGFTVGRTVLSEADFVGLQEEREEMVVEIASTELEVQQTGDELRVQRAEWFENYRDTFVNIEVWSSAGTSASTVLSVSLDAGSGTEIGDGPSFNLSRFTDAGQYMFHRTNNPVRVVSPPSRMRVTSSAGDSVEVDVVEFLDGEYPVGPGAPKPMGDSYATGFVDHYVDATEATDKIEALAAEFPHLAEIIDLPHKSNGYRRKGMATMGSTTSNAVVVTSQAWGHEGGNDVTIAFANPGAPNSPLAVSVDENDIIVSLRTNAAGTPNSTAAQVVAALNSDPAASALVIANTYRGNAGNGTAQVLARRNLSDYLTAPDHVSRDPFQIKAIRIGKHRDGSKVGVFGYSQEHAREWATPLVALETAERLLRNYDQSDEIRKLVDNLDIFILPTVNPDGTHYSIHDFTLQRRSMTNYCPSTGANDLGARNSWGVDLNRNFRVGNLWQGYSGASTSCTSDTFAGPGPLSEPEAQNEVWLVDNHPNIRFAMNIHSHGGYFMWSPGAYRTPGRIQLERPSFGVERFFYEASDVILNKIKEHRGTVVWPGRVGPISDVLYSAAGNSGDDHYYQSDIFAWSFEVGAPRRNNANTGWTSPGFTPPYAEGHEQAMEFSDGLVGMIQVAHMYAKDGVPPRATLTPGAGTYSGSVDVTFELSEPADVYYTLDGSRPTYDSPRLEAIGPRLGAESITISETTTIRWFAVDMAGNVQGNYDPDGKSQNFRQAKLVIEP